MCAKWLACLCVCFVMSHSLFLPIRRVLPRIPTWYLTSNGDGSCEGHRNDMSGMSTPLAFTSPPTHCTGIRLYLTAVWFGFLHLSAHNRIFLLIPVVPRALTAQQQWPILGSKKLPYTVKVYRHATPLGSTIPNRIRWDCRSGSKAFQSKYFIHLMGRDGFRVDFFLLLRFPLSQMERIRPISVGSTYAELECHVVALMNVHYLRLFSSILLAEAKTVKHHIHTHTPGNE